MKVQQLPEGWKLIAFGEIAECISSRVTPKQGDESNFIGLQHISNSSLKIRAWGEDVPLKAQAFKIEKGDILFARRNTYLKRVGLSPLNGICSADVIVLKEKGDFFPQGFLPYFIQSSLFMERAIALSAGSLSSRVKWSTLKDQKFALPYERELQQRLFALLKALSIVQEQIFELKEAAMQIDKSLRASLSLIKGRTHTLEELSEYITSGSRGWAKYVGKEGEMFIRSQNVRDGYLELEDSAFVKLPETIEGKRTKLQYGDIVFTITGNNVGNVAYVPKELGSAYVSQHVALVRLKDPNLHQFVAYSFRRNTQGSRQIELAQYGQSKPGLNLSDIRGFKIAMPAEHELLSYIASINELEVLLDNLTKKERVFNMLRKSLDTKMFRK